MGNTHSAEISRERPRDRARQPSPPPRRRPHPSRSRFFTRTTAPAASAPEPATLSDPPVPGPATTTTTPTHRLSKPRTRSRSRSRSLVVSGLFRKKQPEVVSDAGRPLPPAVARLATSDLHSQHGSQHSGPASPYSARSACSAHSAHSPRSPALDRPLPALPSPSGGEAARRHTPAVSPLSPSMTPRSFLFTFDDVDDRPRGLPGRHESLRDSGVVWQPLAADRATTLVLPPLSFPADDMMADEVFGTDDEEEDDRDDERRQQQIQLAYRQLERRPPQMAQQTQPVPQQQMQSSPPAAPFLKQDPWMPLQETPVTPVKRRRSRWSMIGLFRGDVRDDDAGLDLDVDLETAIDDDDDDDVAVPAARPTRKLARRLQKRSTVFQAVPRIEDFDGDARRPQRPSQRRRHSMAAAVPSPRRSLSFSAWGGSPRDNSTHDMDDYGLNVVAATTTTTTTTTDDQILRRHYGAWPLNGAHAAPPPEVRALWNYDLSSYAAKRLLHLVDDGGGGGGGSSSQYGSHHSSLHGSHSGSQYGPTAASATTTQPATDPVLYVPVRRRSLAQMPGVATRRESFSGDSLFAGARSMSVSAVSTPAMPAMPSLPVMSATAPAIIPTIQRRPETPPPPRPTTPIHHAPDADDTDYRAIGAFKLGSLHITNGAASPASPESGRRRRRRLSHGSDELPRKERFGERLGQSLGQEQPTKTAAPSLSLPLQIPQIALSDDVFAGFEFCATFARESEALRTNAPLETTSKAMAVDDRLFDLDGDGDDTGDDTDDVFVVRSDAAAVPLSTGTMPAGTPPAGDDVVAPLRASGSTASKASTTSTASSSTAASMSSAATATTAASTASSSATTATTATLAAPLACPVSIFSIARSGDSKRHTVGGVLPRDDDDDAENDVSAPHRSSLPVSAFARQAAAHAARWAVKTDHGADDGWWRAPFVVGEDVSGRSNSLGAPLASAADTLLPSPHESMPPLPTSPPLRHRASYDGRIVGARAGAGAGAVGAAAAVATRPAHRSSMGARPGAAATPYRVLHSYNSPAYRGVPIWG